MQRPLITRRTIPRVQFTRLRCAKGNELKGFVIAGKDRQWHPARARIEGDQVIVSHPEVARPLAVRYAWADNPVCNLYNGAGIPASPFRTDEWAE